MRKVHLTKKVIAAFEFEPTSATVSDPSKTQDIRWDATFRGFGVRVFASGTKTFVLRYAARSGTKRTITIGRVGEMTLEQARERARRLRVEVSDGEDPALERTAQRGAGTVQALADRYLVEHAERKKKDSSVEEDRRNLRLHILPALGQKPLLAVSRMDIQRLQHELCEKPTCANRVVALLSKMFNLAGKWGLVPEGQNPCRHIEHYPEQRRERFLSPEELKRLGQVLSDLEVEELEDPNVLLAIRLLVLTGCRLSEILKLGWSEVRLEKSQLWLEDSKTGRKAVWLPPQAVALLGMHSRLDGSPFVIRGGRPGSHLVNLQKPWRRIRAQARLDEVRLHDLRHTFASIAASKGLSLPIIGALLGHRNTATTARYAHLANDAARQAANTTGLAIAESFLIESNATESAN